MTTHSRLQKKLSYSLLQEPHVMYQTSSEDHLHCTMLFRALILTSADSVRSRSLAPTQRMCYLMQLLALCRTYLMQLLALRRM